MNEEEIHLEIQKFLNEFGDRVSEITYDSWPIWWFFKTEFLGNILPPQFSRNEEIIKAILNNKKLSTKEKIKNKLKIFFIRKSLYYNEKSKFWLSKVNNKRSLLEKNKETIMFLAHTNAILFKNSDEDFEVDRVESVVREVRKDPSLQEYISIIDPLSHNSKLKLLRYPNLVYKFIDNKIQKKAKKNSYELNKKWNYIKKKLKFDSEVKTRIFEHFKPALNFYFSKEVIYIIILYYETYKKIIKEKKIKLLTIYAPSRLIIRCATAAANKIGIKTLHIYHGFGIPTSEDYLPDSVYHTVPGEEFRDRLIKLGVKPERIFITGPVFMDYLLEYKKRVRHTKEKKRILIATQPLAEEKLIKKKDYFNYFNKYLNSLSKLKVDEIIIKPHPREKYIKSYENIINSLDNDKIRMELDQKKQTLYSLLSGSDVLISVGSTVTVEAMVMDIPTLTIDLVEYTTPTLLMEERVNIVHMKPNDDISEITNKILYDKDFRRRIIEKGRRFMGRYLYKVDEMCGKRTLNSMKELIRG